MYIFGRKISGTQDPSIDVMHMEIFTKHAFLPIDNLFVTQRDFELWIFSSDFLRIGGFYENWRKKKYFGKSCRFDNFFWQILKKFCGFAKIFYFSILSVYEKYRICYENRFEFKIKKINIPDLPNFYLGLHKEYQNFQDVSLWEI